MQIALTVLTPQGAQDVVLNVDAAATVSQVAAAVRDTLAPKQKQQPLAPVTRLPVAANAGPGGTTLPGLEPEAPSPVEVPPDLTLFIDGEPVPAQTPANTVLRDGAVVTTEAQLCSATVLSEPAGQAELRVVGGQGAGSVHRLVPGSATIGAAVGSHVQLRSSGVPAWLGTLTIPFGAGDPVFESAPADRGAAPADARLDGQPLEQSQAWKFGSTLRVGSTVLYLTRPEVPDAYLSPTADGGLAYHRPPRLRRPSGPVRIEVPVKPVRNAQTQMLLIGMTVPLVMGGVMVSVTGQWTYALFMLMSPLMMGSQLISSRTKGSRRVKKREYREKLAALPERLDAARVRDEASRRDDNPDPTQILLTATGPRRRLWERRATDGDALRMRVGLFDGPARIRLAAEAVENNEKTEIPPVPTAFCVPIAISLPQYGVVGLAGQMDASRALARWWVAQSAVLHSPGDLSIVVLTAEPEAARHWNWVRWLPHNAPRGNEECISLLGTDMASSAERVNELLVDVTERLAKVAETTGASLGPASGPGARQQERPGPELGPQVIVVLDGARRLRRLPGMQQLLASARSTGIYAICIDESTRVLPEECSVVLNWEAAAPALEAWEASAPPDAESVDAPSTIRLRGGGLDALPPVLADQVTVAWASRVARALSPVRDVSKDDAAASIPDSARLLDLIHMPDPTAELVNAAWQRYGRSTRAPMGVDADGLHVIDISEDGPHALIAGTTGAGKSEFLQTLIAGLAVMNRPDSMTFVLIDYKGGSAFKDCARLPHTVGMVTDLDGHLTIRALDSLGAELHRREEMLLHAGAKDIGDYLDTKRLQPDLEPMPRLVLIIDEFAAMVATLPDFVEGLIDIARRGRSLGVHLILATQRPAGVVSADIRANTNLRVALRVTSTDESADVIDTGDAAHISKTTPGRCYVRSGASNPLAVQSARVGGRRPGVGSVAAAAQVISTPWKQLSRPLTLPATSGGDDEIDLATDLSVLTEAIRAANEQQGFGEQRRPWLEPLPEIVTLDALPEAGPSRTDIPCIPFGLTDLPLRQSREALTLDFADAGHTVVAGAAHTGRSAVLRTLACSVARETSPADVHIYGIDCGTGALLPVAELPHCGAVVPRDQPDRVERLLSKLRDEIHRRQQLLAAEGFTGLIEQRSATTGTKLPWMLLMLDWWEGFHAAFEQYDYGRLIDDLLQILREGSAVGLRAVVTTDRAALLGQTGSVFSRQMILRLGDRDDAELADVRSRSLPNHQPEGRVMFAAKPHPLEAQIALLDPDPGSLAQARALREIAAQVAERHERPPAELRPLRVDALPMRITLPQTWALDEDFVVPSPLWALVGAGGDELGPVGLDVGSEGPGIVVAGPPRSGRSTTLMTMAKSLLRAQTPIFVITPRRSPLRLLDGEPGVLAVRGADFDADEMRQLVNPLERYVVLVDDAELLIDSPASDLLERVIVSGRDSDHGLILAGATGDLGRVYNGFIATALKSRCGVLVSVETPDDGDLFGLKLPRNARRAGVGRGLVVRSGTTAPIQQPVDDD